MIDAGRSRALLLPALLAALAACRRDEGFAKRRDEILADAYAEVARRGKIGQGFVDDVARGDTRSAYERTSKIYRATVPFERFDKGIRAHPYLTAGGTYTSRRTVQRGSNVTVEGTLATADGPITADLSLLATTEGESIAGFRIGGQEALPQPAP